MKVADLDQLFFDQGERGVELTLNESKFLTVLTHPHIIKYYTSFKEDNSLYLIIENAENGDLESYIESNKKIGRHIPEDELWSIFLQCMQGLAYIHKRKVIHRDIKLGNILMDNNMTIKIGDFGTCAVKKNKDSKVENPKYLNANYGSLFDEEKMQYHQTKIVSKNFTAKEVLNDLDYDQKVDVYSMGVTFYYMCYYCYPGKGIKNNPMGYSKELLDIIDEMIEPDKDKRKSSKYFLKRIEEEFSKRYNRNTSIDAIVRCLYTFNAFKNYYKTLKDNEIKNKLMTNAFAQCLKNFTEKDFDLYYNSIKNLRAILCTLYTKFDKIKEINPKLVLPFLLRQLNQEMNIGNNNLDNKENSHFLTSGLEESFTNEIEVLLNFNDKFLTKLKSFVIKKFAWLEEKCYKCFNCEIETYSFAGYFYITLDLEKIPHNIRPDIENYLNYTRNIWTTTEKHCSKCLMKTQHEEYKKYHTSPDYLIVLINRGNNDSNKNSVRLRQVIDLRYLTVTTGKIDRLNGFITKNYENGNYVSYFEFKFSKDNKKWYKCEGEDVNEINIVESKILNDAKGEIMMAFYEDINENYLQLNTSIDAIVRCLYSFNDLTNYYKKLNNNEIKDKVITKIYAQCLKNYIQKDLNLYFNSIKYFREILCTQNTKFDKTKEINPKLVLAFLLRQLHQEMNLGNINWEDEKNNYYMKSGIEEALTNGIEMQLKFDNIFLTKLNSFISRKFVGLEERLYKCFVCQIETYSFAGYFYITLDLEKITDPDIEKYFYYRNNTWITTEKYCPKCLMKTQHEEYKKYFTSPDYLIILINRGSNDSHRNQVMLKQEIDLTYLTVTIGRKYKLIGFISKNYENGKYDSYFEFRKTKNWFKCEGENIKGINQIELNQILNDSNGEIMMVFYEAI